MEYSEISDFEEGIAAKPRVFTVSDLNREIRLTVEEKFPAVWVEAEISNFKKHTSGHMYLTLKDDKSQINAVFFSRLNQGLKFELKDGLKVLVFGRITIYEPRGQYQVFIQKIEPRGVGALQLAFLQLKEKLDKEGLFDRARKRAIPRFPRTVGVVTSPTGAAIRDILNVVNRRFMGTRILINPVRVQGDGAAGEIARAIEEMNGLEPGIDVLIVGRGGGSLEDLWAFNEEIVARAVYASRIPVISAVGHEIDWTICDWVADLRAPTPSAAAELVVQSRAELEKNLKDSAARMGQAVRSLVRDLRQKIVRLESSYALKQPQHLVIEWTQRLDELVRQLQNYVRNLTAEKAHGLGSLAGRLEALSPLAVLKRGYSLTYGSDGRLILRAVQARPGETLRTRVSEGFIESQVTGLIRQEEGE